VENNIVKQGGIATKNEIIAFLQKLKK